MIPHVRSRHECRKGENGAIGRGGDGQKGAHGGADVERRVMG